MKKGTLLLCLLFLLSMIAVPVHAAEPSMTLAADTEKTEAGQELTVTVSLADTPKAKSAGLTFYYDAEVLQLTGGTWLLTGSTLKNVKPEKNVAAIAFGALTDFNGDILTVKFNVLKTVTQPVTLTASFVMNNATVTVASGTAELTFNKATPGDMNGDTGFNAADVIYLLKALFNPTDYPIAQGVNPDTNGDSAFNASDVIYLLKALFNPTDYPLN